MPKPSTRRIAIADIAAMPWKNGGGVTREIATGALPGPKQAWGWRVSLAEVATDGPFSIFPDTERVIAVIEGAGMDLVRPDGTALALEPFAPVRFAGEDSYYGRLRGGPVRDLNVMVRRGRFEAEMEIHQGPCTFDATGYAGGALLVLSFTDDCRLYLPDSEDEKLAEGEALIHEGPGSLEIEIAEGGRAAVIRIRSRPG